MVICPFSGNSDMYGLGIRIGFYLQWFGTILATWIARKEVTAMRLSNAFFVTATFLALLIRIHHNHNHTLNLTTPALHPVEIYITLLLLFGNYLFLVPLYIWRLLIGCDPDLDPSRHPRVTVGAMFSRLSFGLLCALCIFQLWLWIGKVGKLPTLGKEECSEVGFLFARVRLNQKGFVVLNVVLYFLLLLACVAVFGIGLGKRWGVLEEREGRGIGPVRKAALQEMQTFVNLTVASIMVAATELTIAWNQIRDVYRIDSAGQLIPLVISVGQIVRVLYVLLVTGDNYTDYDSDTDSYYSWTGSTYSRSGPLGVDRTPVGAHVNRSVA